jgi:hypothetical protein
MTDGAVAAWGRGWRGGSMAEAGRITAQVRLHAPLRFLRPGLGVGEALPVDMRQRELPADEVKLAVPPGLEARDRHCSRMGHLPQASNAGIMLGVPLRATRDHVAGSRRMKSYPLGGFVQLSSLRLAFRQGG